MTQSNELKVNSQIPKSLEITAVLPLLCHRTGSELSNQQMALIADDIANEFSKVEISVIHSALKRGGLGYYGITYKITTQVLCSWIRQEINYRATHNEDGTERMSI